jgi:aminoglycoside phosphotransferase family enzyme
MAYVFLTDERAYKLKKSVKFDFLDFSTVALRRHVCEEEVRLNRRLAPDVYLGTVPLVRDARGALHVGMKPESAPIDWLVKMRRLPSDRMLDQVIRARGPRRHEVAALSVLLVTFYRGAPRVSISHEAYVDRLDSAIATDVRDLGAWHNDLPISLIRSVGSALRGRLLRERRSFGRRAAHIVEAHGDLRPEHICLTDPPVIIDCLEFRRDFRILDPLDELAFLGMECERLGDVTTGPTLLRLYEEGTCDHAERMLTEFYAAMRALLRAKLAIWHLRDGASADSARWRSSARAYLELAVRHSGRDVSRS